jgi:hypothetical protein
MKVGLRDDEVLRGHYWRHPACFAAARAAVSTPDQFRTKVFLAARGGNTWSIRRFRNRVYVTFYGDVETSRGI